MLWDAHSGPLFAAAIELWVAARTDAELRADLVAVEREVTKTVWTAGGELFPDYAGRAGVLPRASRRRWPPCAGSRCWG